MASEWTFETLKEYLVQLMIERDSQYAHRLGELEMTVKDIAVLKQSIQSASDAIKAQERHVAIVQVASQTAIDKAEEAQIRYNEETARSRELRDAAANEFRATIADTTSTMFPRKEAEGAIAALRSELLGKIDTIEKRAEEERRRADRDEGKSLGSGATIAFIVAAIGVVGTIIAIVLSLH